MNITWTPSPNYSRGRGSQIQYISLHIMAGYLAGTDATFLKTSSKASSHYGIGPTGLIHQYVREQHTAWCDGAGANNSKSISIEHEGGIAAAPCTDACMNASAELCAEIARRQGWKRLSRGINVKLHRDIPPYSHPSCPDLTQNGLNWQYVINRANQLLGDRAVSTEADVWSYTYNHSTTAWNYLTNIYDRVADAPGRVWTYTWGGSDNMFNTLMDTHKQVIQLNAQLTALTSAVSALSTAQGLDPDAVTKSIDAAVKESLSDLNLTFTMTPKENK